jgi:hypothetical protein
LKKVSDLKVINVLKSFNALEELINTIEVNINNSDFIKDNIDDIINTTINIIKEHPEFETSNLMT